MTPDPPVIECASGKRILASAHWLVSRQRTVLNPTARKKLFDEAQVIMAEQQPFLFLASRHLLVAARTDIGNFKPALLSDFVLWNCEELYRK